MSAEKRYYKGSSDGKRPLAFDPLEGAKAAYDVIVVVGNVMVYLAEGTETRALRTLHDLLAPEGRILVGFNPEKGPPHSRDYPRSDFRTHAAAAGLAVEHEFRSYDLRPAGGDYVVAVLRRDR